MAASHEEKIAHVIRRLGIGGDGSRVAEYTDADEAIAATLAIDRTNALDPDKPGDWDDAEERYSYPQVVSSWIDRLVRQDQPLLERMTWLWHDHFATSITKVSSGYLMWRQHTTLRRHALGNFRDLLQAVARDPAMLIYLDGDPSTKDEFNENFAREVMELHTMGRGSYSEADVKNAARAFTGWHVEFPGEEPNAQAWDSVFDPANHDGGTKTIFGVAGRHGMEAALDLILEQPATGPFIAARVYRELVGLAPDARLAKRLGDDFATTWDIGRLVEAIVGQPAFLSDTALRARVRTPLEKVVTLLQGFSANPDFEIEWLAWGLESQSYRLFAPPNPAGYPRGSRLLSPSQLTNAFGLLNVVAEPVDMPNDEILMRLGLYDLGKRTSWVLDKPWSAGTRLALAFGSPEFAMT